MSFIQQFAIALFIVSLIGIIRTQGKQKAIASGLLALSLVLGFQYGSLNSAGYQETAPIVINHDGEYELPARPLKVCFKQTGHPDKFWINQEVTIDNTWRIIEPFSKCHNIPHSGKKVHVSLGSFSKQYTPEIKKKFNIGAGVNNDYEYYEKMPGGQSGYPIILPR